MPPRCGRGPVRSRKTAPEERLQVGPSARFGPRRTTREPRERCGFRTGPKPVVRFVVSPEPFEDVARNF